MKIFIKGRLSKSFIEAIKRSIKILKIDKNSVTIGSKKGYWSRGLEFGNKKWK